MLKRFWRHGSGDVPETQRIVDGCRARGETIQGPDIHRFEDAFGSAMDMPSAVATSSGRMAFAYILKAFNFPPGSEVILPALTFWAIPEMVRVAGLKPVAADVDPRTFTLDPAAFERAITDRTVAVVPTHLYGLPCDMAAILGLARRHGLAAIEDCSQALGARYRGRRVGTFGDAAFFSLQTLTPLNTYGGGMAVARGAGVLARIRQQAEAERWPAKERIENRLKVETGQRLFSRPRIFSLTAYPAVLATMLWHVRPDVYLWEPIRSLDPMPDSYRERYTNVQAAIGLAALPQLDRWNGAARANARVMDESLRGLRGVSPPYVPLGCEHVYYQYSVYAPERDALVRKARVRGIDVETFHADLWPSLPLFRMKAYAPYAAQAGQVIQLPVHASLSTAQVGRIARRMRSLLSSTPAASEEARTDIA